jgi:cbb3-type cytochrome oxidase maturation protein
MDALIFLVPIAIGLGAVFAGLFIAAAARGQFDDIDDAPQRMLDD